MSPWVGVRGPGDPQRDIAHCHRQSRDLEPGSPIRPPCPSRRFGGALPAARGRDGGSETRSAAAAGPRRGTAPPAPLPLAYLHLLAAAEPPRRSPRAATAEVRARAGVAGRGAAGHRPPAARRSRRAPRAAACRPLPDRGPAPNEGLEVLSDSGQPLRQPPPSGSAASAPPPLRSQSTTGPRRRHLPGYLTATGRNAPLIDSSVHQSNRASRSGGGSTGWAGANP